MCRSLKKHFSEPNGNQTVGFIFNLFLPVVVAPFSCFKEHVKCGDMLFEKPSMHIGYTCALAVPCIWGHSGQIYSTCNHKQLFTFMNNSLVYMFMYSKIYQLTVSVASLKYGA